jgi:NADH:ubiquinone oxidoreductase subunit 3 (subunit A)
MKSIFEAGRWFIYFIFFMLFDLVAYYRWGKHHSFIPLILGAVLSSIVFAITCLAAYESYKHRNDKEPW